MQKIGLKEALALYDPPLAEEYQPASR